MEAGSIQADLDGGKGDLGMEKLKVCSFGDDSFRGSDKSNDAVGVVEMAALTKWQF